MLDPTSSTGRNTSKDNSVLPEYQGQTGMLQQNIQGRQYGAQQMSNNGQFLGLQQPFFNPNYNLGFNPTLAHALQQQQMQMMTQVPQQLPLGQQQVSPMWMPGSTPQYEVDSLLKMISEAAGQGTSGNTGSVSGLSQAPKISSEKPMSTSYQSKLDTEIKSGPNTNIKYKKNNTGHKGLTTIDKKTQRELNLQTGFPPQGPDSDKNDDLVNDEEFVSNTQQSDEGKDSGVGSPINANMNNGVSRGVMSSQDSNEHEDIDQVTATMSHSKNIVRENKKAKKRPCQGTTYDEDNANKYMKKLGVPDHLANATMFMTQEEIQERNNTVMTLLDEVDLLPKEGVKEETMEEMMVRFQRNQYILLRALVNMNHLINDSLGNADKLRNRFYVNWNVKSMLLTERETSRNGAKLQGFIRKLYEDYEIEGKSANGKRDKESVVDDHRREFLNKCAESLGMPVAAVTRALNNRSQSLKNK